MDYTANDIVSLSAGRAFREKIGYSKYLIFDDGIVTHFVALSNSFLKKICVCGQNSVQKNEKVRLLYGRLSCCRLKMG